MVSSTRETLKMFGQTTLEGFGAATSSPELEDGLKLCDSPVGPTIAKYGPAVVRANLSARQARAMGLLTSGICGRHGSISSQSADLQLSLESRLMQQFDGIGSTLFTLTWRALATPSHRPFFQLRALALRNRDTDYSSWPTPMAGTPAQRGYNEAGNNDSSRKTVALCRAPIELPASGETPTGSTAQIANIGQLSPAHSRWLMGYRPAWDDCGVMAMPSFRKLRRAS
jgi:hypothetical protein